MKKLFLVLSLLTSLSLEAQFVTTYAKNTSETQEDGVFYYLPRNIIKIDFTIEETNYLIGPYAEFTTKLMGTSDYIKENKTEYEIKSVDIQLADEPDPNAVFLISSDEKSKEPLPNVILDSDGIILALGFDSIPVKSKIHRNAFIINDLNNAKSNNPTFIDILESEIEVEKNDDDDEEEGSSAPKKITKEDKANAVINKIAKIRNAYFELISGFNEVVYGNTTTYMVDQMKELENEYISLFKGKTIKSSYNKTVYLVPDAKQANASVSIDKIAGEQIKIQFENKNQLADVNSINDETIKNGQSNKLFYRIPAETNLKILSGNNVIAEKQLTISQFGKLRVISAKNNKILFNPNTGQIISVLK